MKKVMFKDFFGLTQAVLEGRKLMARRIIKMDKLGEYNFDNALKYDWGKKSIQAYIQNEARYKVGEVVAIAQSYKDAGYSEKEVFAGLSFNWAGWNNKLFVAADKMPHHIRITDVKVERLQDISDEDCIKEGIWKANNVCFEGVTYWYHGLINSTFRTPRDAFAALIDKVSGKGAWESNPWVFVYEFELVD